MCPHVDQVTWSTRRYRSGARNGSVTYVDWHFVSLTTVGQEAGGDEEERQSKEKIPSDRSQKGGKAPKEEAVPEVHAGHAEDPTSKERAHMRGPEEEITPSPLRGHLGDQAHF